MESVAARETVLVDPCLRLGNARMPFSWLTPNFEKKINTMRVGYVLTGRNLAILYYTGLITNPDWGWEQAFHKIKTNLPLIYHRKIFQIILATLH